MNRLPNTLRCLAAGLALAAGANSAGAAGFTDALVQAPNVAKPERGSVVGSLSKLSFGPADLLRGSFSLPSPFEVPGERASILASIFPTYSPETGISEWGVGWQGALRIHRFRAAGDIDYAADEFSSPWGRLVRGDSADEWYPTGLRGRILLRFEDGDWIAIAPDGTEQRFEQRLDTAAGTYAWYLTSVETALGDMTALSYETNASGRPFLAAVEYGSRTNTDTYRVSFSYEGLAEPFASYAAGERVELDRRVSGVMVESRSHGGGSYAERWHYDIGYEESPSGPAFFMSSVQRVFASGDAEPAVVYEYDLGAGKIAGAEFEHIPGLDEYLSLAGSTGLSPENVTITDLENDGMLDLEHFYAQVMLHQTDTGWSFEMPPPAPPWVDRRCRPKASMYNDPRSLVRMIPEEAEPQVVVTDSDAVADTTDILVCDRAGAPEYEVTVDGTWEIGRNTRLTDVNRDNKPDLVAVFDGEVRFLQNVSDDAGYGFAERGAISLSPSRAPDTSWIYDVNADGRQDLIVRSAGEGSVYVWYGTGNFGLDPNGQELTFSAAGGYDISSVAPYGLAFVDANKDGLLDILLSEDFRVRLFMNRGGHRFEELEVDGLDGLTWDASNPLIADMSGAGNTEIVYTSNKQAFALALNGPETGLMNRVDDGKGTVIELGYVRAPAWAGVGYRPSVLDTLTVSSSGYDTVTYQYGYENPVMHSQGRYLVGYGQTQKLSPILSETVSFYNDDDLSGIVEASYQTDARTPGLMKFQTSEYEEAAFDGVRLRRATSKRTGWRRFSDLAEVAMGQAILAYDHGLCPTSVSGDNGYGTLLRETVLADVPGLDGALHCMPERESLIGTHADASLDFEVAQRIERNSLGQVTRVVQEGDGEEIVQQTVTYDGYGRPIEIATPSTGARTISYDSATGVATGITSPDGSSIRVAELDPITGAITEYQRDKGAGGVLRLFYRYDGMERLASSWQDFGGSSEAMPQMRYDYQFASYEQPGAVIASALVDATSGTYKDSATLSAADGAVIAQADRIPEGWSLAGLTRMVRNDRIAYSYARSPLGSGTDITALAYDDLFEGAQMLSLAESAGFGHPTTESSLVQTGVVNNAITELAFGDAGEIVTTVTENTTRATKSATDAEGKTLWIEDANGVRTEVLYDAMSRVVGVRLADGTEHSVRFDSFGRPVRVTRPGVAAIEYSYAPATGKLVERRILDAFDAVERRTYYTYDSIGREIARSHVLESTGERRDLTFHYDGSGSGDEPTPGQLGYMSQIDGDAFTSRVAYNPDGSVRSTEMSVGGWMAIDHDHTYFANGKLASVVRTVTNLQTGELVEQVDRSFVYDVAGRLAELQLDGTTLATIVYDAEGRVQRAELAIGDQVVLHYDDATRALNGYWLDNGLWNAGVDWELDSFGNVRLEKIAINDERWDRSYEYDARGFLTGATDDGAAAAGYEYDALGMPSWISDQLGEREVAHHGDEMQVGDDLYVFDSLGRVVDKGDMSFEYGPDGHLARATRGSDVFEFAYDENGSRILKIENGTPVAAYIGGGYLTADGFVEPVRIADRVVGVIAGGSFEMVATDPRGTMLANADGTPNIASPYGVRTEHPELAAALDYVEKGYDADLGTVRMGVRDYDPRASQFLTPDPLFLENVDKCVTSPVECNLYSYAGNDPVNFTDPTGTEKKKTWNDLKVGDRVGALTIANGDTVTKSKVDVYQSTIKSGTTWNRQKYRYRYYRNNWKTLWTDQFTVDVKSVPKLDLEATYKFIGGSLRGASPFNKVGNGVSAQLVLFNGTFMGWKETNDSGGTSLSTHDRTVKKKSVTDSTEGSAGIEVGIDGVGKVTGGAKFNHSETNETTNEKGVRDNTQISTSFTERKAVIRGDLYIEYKFVGGGMLPDHITVRVPLGRAEVLYSPLQ